MKHHLPKSLLAAFLVLGATLGSFAQTILITNNFYSAGQFTYDFGPVTVSAFLGETEIIPNSFISSGNLQFLGINSSSFTNDNGVNSINDIDGVLGGGDQERLRLEIATGYYLTNITWNWSRANGPLPTDGVSISGFSSNPGAVFNGGTSGTPLYTNGTLTFQAEWSGTLRTVSFTNYEASVNATLEIICADSTQAGAQFTPNSFLLAPVPPPTPEITTQPVPATRYVQDGTNVFSVVAFSAGTVGYQWYKAPSTLLLGATNNTLTLQNLALGDAGNYYVVVTNTLGGSVQSDTVSLTVNSWVAPSFTVNPMPVSAYIHQTVSFTALATGSPAWSLNYQWNQAGSPIPGATNTTLVLNDISIADGVSYTCVANNGVGSPATGSGALLTVLTPTAGSYAAAAIDSEPIVYHRYSNVATTSNVYNYGTMGISANGNLSGFYYTATGPQPPDFPNFETGNPAPDFDGFSANGNIPPLGVLGNTATMAAWIYLNGPQVPNAGIVYQRAVGGNGSGIYVKKDSTQAYDVLGYAWNNQRWNTTNDALALPMFRWLFVAVVVEPTQATLYVQDGTNMITQVDTFAQQSANFSSTTRVGWDSNGALDARRFYGVIDEVTIYNRSLSPSEVLNLYAASSNYPPTIVTSPQNATNYTGLPFSLSVTAQGMPPMAYQWYKQGVGAVEGATNDLYSVSEAVLGDSGSYFVVASNPIGMVTSAVANVTVLAQSPIITALPQSTTNWLGLNASFTAAAVGSAPISYQWSKVGVGDLPGETNATFTLTAIMAGDAGDYFVTVNNSEGSSDSPAATLTVVNPNTVDQQLYFTNGYTALRSNFTGTIGTRFLMGDYDRTVTHLGFFDADGDGLTMQHSVGVYTLGDPAGTGVLLGDVTVPMGTAASYTNGFRWVALASPVTLSNGQEYVIAATVVNGADAWPREWQATFNEVFVGYTAATNRVLVYSGGAAWPAEPANPVLNNLGATYGAYNLISSASAVPTVELSIEKVGTDVRLTWPEGVLQQADKVNGDYTTVPAATSPYIIPAGGQSLFFRVQVN